MKVITISREFGSGGRELGKRMADILGFDYYDKEIILDIAQRHNLDADYVENAIGKAGQPVRPLTFRSSIAGIPYVQSVSAKLLAEQTGVIRKIGEKGRDCILIGRNADLILAAYRPFRVFVYAEEAAKIQRCMERAGETEALTEKELRKKIRQIDAGREKTRSIMGADTWGQRELYDLLVNTTGWEIKELAGLVAGYAEKWFERA